MVSSGWLTVTVTDDAGGVGSASATVVVKNVAPSVDEGPDDKEIDEGGTYTSSVSFADPGADEWTATVDYGDGSPVEDLTLDGRTALVDYRDGTLQTLEMIGKTFQLSHTYAANEACGPFTVTVTVTDDDGAEGSGTAEVAVIHQISVYNANVRLERGRSRSGPRDRFDVAGRLPLSLLACFDPYYEAFTINFAGFEGSQGLIPPGSFVRKDDKWVFKASPHTQGIQRIDLRDDGRFKIQATGLYLRGGDFDFSKPVDFSLLFGPDDMGKASIPFDRRLHFPGARR